MEGESFFPTFVYRLIFMRKFDHFVVSVDRKRGKKDSCASCLVPSAIAFRFFEIKNKIQNQSIISSSTVLLQYFNILFGSERYRFLTLSINLNAKIYFSFLCTIYRAEIIPKINLHRGRRRKSF